MKPIKLLLLLLISTPCYTTEIYKPIGDQQQNKIQYNLFEHPTKVFTLKVPTNWGKPIKFKYDPNVFNFYPSESSEFTVSITQNLNLPSELPVYAFKWLFPEEVPITKLKREKGMGWNSARQDYQGTKNGKKRVWLAVFYGVGSNAVAITLSDYVENINNHKAVFEFVIKSIAINANIYN